MYGLHTLLRLLASCSARVRCLAHESSNFWAMIGAVTEHLFASTGLRMPGHACTTATSDSPRAAATLTLKASAAAASSSTHFDASPGGSAMSQLLLARRSEIPRVGSARRAPARSMQSAASPEFDLCSGVATMQTLGIASIHQATHMPRGHAVFVQATCACQSCTKITEHPGA